MINAAERTHAGQHVLPTTSYGADMTFAADKDRVASA